MWRSMCKSKIHRVTVTEADLNYPGSLTVDSTLLAAADILPFEQVQVVNVSNGARFETYIIEGAAGSGEICLNGAAARLGHPGDIIIIISYAFIEDSAARQHSPVVVQVDARNRLVENKEQEQT